MSNNSIVVAGDVMIDWNLTVDRDVAVATRSWREAASVKPLREFGGAWLLADLIEKFAAKTPYADRVRRIPRPTTKQEALIHQTYTELAPAKDGVWRVGNFIGVRQLEDGGLRVERDDPDADIVVLLDSDLSFDPTDPSLANEEAWPAAIRNDDSHPWVVFKTSVPMFDGALWKRLVTHHADRLIVVMTVEDLRRREIKLLRRLSWERAAQDLVSQMRGNPALRALDDCRHIIVSFGPAGAMLMSRGDTPPQLVFDPAAMEGEWETRDDEKRTGTMIGYTSVLVAAIARELMDRADEPELTAGIARGIAGMRALFINGFGKDREPRANLDAVAKAALEAVPDKVVSTAVVSDVKQGWTILGDRLKTAAAIWPGNDVSDVLYERAARAAIYKPEVALADVPRLTIGKLISVDREEIEALRSIKGLLGEYVKRKPSKPFSIAVFGTPGSGKSFAVEEIAKSVGGDKIKVLTFNVTQFAHANELHGAFHQVRDEALRGKIPVVFWDEFDTTKDVPLGWLRYFIGPMQDGTFQEDQITHPIGTSIFVFAGGTASTMDEFVRTAPEEVEKRKALKVPDFVSRLKGFLNVTGPNRRHPEGDPHYLIRRGLLLRSLVEKLSPDLLSREKVLRIDPDVLYALLNAQSYRHGARSLESVIVMSSLAGRTYFDSSSLPPEGQLALHMEAGEDKRPPEWKFAHDYVRLEELAAMAHAEFRKAREDADWTPGDERDDDKKIHDLLRQYEDLPEVVKESNRATIRWIPKKIDRVNYAMVPAGSGERQEMTEEEVERLAKFEHELWAERKVAAGFKHGDKVTKSPKQTRYLVSWEALPEDMKKTDRAMILAIPKFLRKAGFVLVKKQPQLRYPPT